MSALTGVRSLDASGANHKRRSPAATGLQRHNTTATSSVWNSTAKTPLPPYGNAVAKSRNPNVFLYTGPRAWEMAKARRALCGDDAAMVLPEGHGADKYTWPALTCLLVVAVDLDRKQAVQIGAEIARQGTELVVVACYRHELVFIRRGKPQVTA